MFSSEIWVALFTLATLEIVLGVDNLVFISIAVSRLPPERRPAARRFGLMLACVTAHPAAGVAGLPGAHAGQPVLACSGRTSRSATWC